MKYSLKLITFIYLFVNSAFSLAIDRTLDPLTQDDFNEMFGAPPDKSIKNWVRLDILGPVNHPFPYLWVSPQAFVRHPPNYVIKVEKAEYKKFTKFIGKRKCSINYDENTLSNPLRITEYLHGKEKVLCIASVEKVCGYLLDILASSSIRWDAQKLSSFQWLVNEYDCPEVQRIIESKKTA